MTHPAENPTSDIVFRSHDEPTLVLTRRYGRPVARMWTALTDADDLRGWMPCDTEIDVRAGGRVSFSFPGAEPEHGEVLAVDPPRLLRYRWDSEVLTWELAAADADDDSAGCTLTLTTTVQDVGHTAHNAAGWYRCLDDLARVVDVATVQPETPAVDDLVTYYRSAFSLTR